MCHLDHPNVQTLIGVCLDAEVPYLIMPLMERGSLLMYLRKERGHLLMSEDIEDYQVYILCLAIDCIMSIYLPNCKFADLKC